MLTDEVRRLHPPCVLVPTHRGVRLGCTQHRLVDVIIGIYGFALLRAVAYPAALRQLFARRNLCSPINCTLLGLEPTYGRMEGRLGIEPRNAGIKIQCDNRYATALRFCLQEKWKRQPEPHRWLLWTLAHEA